MFINATKTTIKITNWGLVKGEDYATTGNNSDNSNILLLLIFIEIFRINSDKQVKEI
jgi:hypothetical protein